MKIVFKSLIFCVFVAIIWLLFSLLSRPSQKFDTASLFSGNVERMGNEIAQQWSARSGWDNDLYQAQMTKIAQSYSANLIDRTARKTLYDRVNREAYSKATEAMDREFSRNNCDASILADNYAGITTIAEREPSIVEIPQVATALATYSLYRRAISFIKSPIGLTPHFDIEAVDWTPRFEPYAIRINNQKQALTSDRLFSRISHINDIRRIHETSSRIDEARTRYYASLSQAVASAFDNALSPDSDNSDLRMKLQELRSKAYQIAPSSFNTDMSSLYRRLFING